MAKTSMKAREEKRQRTVLRFSEKRTNLKEIIIDGREFIEMTEKVSEQQLKTGADGIPPVFEMFNAGLLVSI